MTPNLNNPNIYSRILKIAFPTILGHMGLVLFETADVFWIGKLSSKAVAAVGAAAFMEWAIYSLMGITTTGCSTLVSQLHGAKEKKKIYQVINESLWLSLFISLGIMLFLIFFTSDLFFAMGLDKQTHTLAMDYFIVFIIGFPMLYIMALQDRIFAAYGDTKTSTIIMTCALLINLVLDPILIFGWFGMPEMGIKGASVATIISETIGVAIRLYYLRKKEYIGPLGNLTKFSSKYFIKVMKIGIPSATTNFVWTIVFPLLTIIITKFGMEPLAGLNIGNRVEGIPYFAAFGFSIAVGALVGQSYGAKKYDEVREIVKKGIFLITAILVPVSLIFIIFPHVLIGLLNSDPEVIKHGSEYLRIVGYLELFLGWEMVIEGGFNGLGNTKPYMLLRVPLTFARIPIAYFLAIYLELGVTGVWWAISFTTFLKGAGLVVLFKTNKTNKQLLSYNN